MGKENSVFNLTDNAHYKIVRNFADNFLSQGMSPDGLWELAGGQHLFFSLAAFLALSKLSLKPHKAKKLRIAILMNLIHEQNRLRPVSSDNPNGENSLENKLAQLQWIFEGTEIDYKLIYVSGGCPWGSDEVLDSEILRTGSAQKVFHIKIADYDTSNFFVRNRKGGEVIFGMRSILQLPGYADAGYFDAMLFTDADMTFDLGQLGMLIDKYFSGKDILIGNRMDSRSILVKNMVRAGTGVLMYRHIQRKLAPQFFVDLNLHDTQCPWKFLSRRVMSDIAPDLDSMDWSIDTDILSAAMKYGYKLNIFPVTAIDSELESHGRAIGHFRRNRTIIEGTIHQAEKYGLCYDREIAVLVRKYLSTDEDYKRLLDAGLPPTLKALPNKEWGSSELISTELVEKWLKRLKKITYNLL